MAFIATIAERRILEAMERGDFDNLPGKGRPIEVEDLSGVPVDSGLWTLETLDSGLETRDSNAWPYHSTTHKPKTLKLKNPQTQKPTNQKTASPPRSR